MQTWAPQTKETFGKSWRIFNDLTSSRSKVTVHLWTESHFWPFFQGKNPSSYHFSTWKLLLTFWFRILFFIWHLFLRGLKAGFLEKVSNNLASVELVSPTKQGCKFKKNERPGGSYQTLTIWTRGKNHRLLPYCHSYQIGGIQILLLLKKSAQQVMLKTWRDYNETVNKKLRMFRFNYIKRQHYTLED